ncbi:sulfatase-like hydrolase/transferase [Rhodopirellula sp. JC639]|uniref:sulfatase-like hydrolase/transferase n=1 Tax=Stieleria mannarensis TaxID=2755585 RepID=UPI0015FF636C|nr:sulfatase-like hydrolase/transferase [Rhodopirellula sp. JC639]
MIHPLAARRRGRCGSASDRGRCPLALLVALAGGFFACGILNPCLLQADSATRPNIVLILADDLGYGDVGCYGQRIAKTPNIDALAKQGVRFTQHYSNGPECSPTRTALLTGRYQQRVGGLECAIGTGNVGRYDDAIRLAEQHELGLPVDHAVLPGMLAPAGYRCGLFGKWHLGYETKFNPMEYGWDEFVGYLGGNVHYFNHRELSDIHVLFRGRQPIKREGYMTHLITDDSIEFIKRHKDQPFFAYVAHECPHFPYQGPGDKDKVVTEENWMALDSSAYVAMIEDLDSEVGRILQTLDEQGIADNTIVIFASDNGGFAGAGDMGPLRGSKGTTYEGGIRVPMVVRWPNRIRGGTVSDQVCVTFDLTRSILALAGADESHLQLEGMDILSHVAEQRAGVARTLFWRGRRGKRTWTAVREGDLKLVRKREGTKVQQWLYNLSDDLSESSDLAASRPQDVDRLELLIDQWEKDVRPLR